MKGKITAEILSKTRNVNTINEEMVFYFLSQIKFSIVIFPVWQHCKARRFNALFTKINKQIFIQDVGLYRQHLYIVGSKHYQRIMYVVKGARQTNLSIYRLIY